MRLIAFLLCSLTCSAQVTLTGNVKLAGNVLLTNSTAAASGCTTVKDSNTAAQNFAQAVNISGGPWGAVNVTVANGTYNNCTLTLYLSTNSGPASITFNVWLFSDSANKPNVQMGTATGSFTYNQIASATETPVDIVMTGTTTVSNGRIYIAWQSSGIDATHVTSVYNSAGGGANDGYWRSTDGVTWAAVNAFHLPKFRLYGN